MTTDGEDAATRKMLDAVRALLEDVLDSKGPMRFAEAARICTLAHSLVQARTMRVGHFAGEYGAADIVGPDMGMNLGPAIYHGNARNLVMPRPVMGHNPRDDQAQRDAAMGADQVAQSTVDANRSAVRVVEARELVDLLDARKRIADAGCAAFSEPTTEWLKIVDGRIANLMRRLEARNADNVVPADDARGREAGTGGGEGAPAHEGDGQRAVND